MTKRLHAIGGLLLLAMSCGSTDESTSADDTTSDMTPGDSIAPGGNSGAQMAATSSAATAPSLAVMGAAGGSAPLGVGATPSPSVISTTPAASAQAQASAATAPPPATMASCDMLQLCCGALTDATVRGTCEAVAMSQAQAACSPLVEMLCSAAMLPAAQDVSAPEEAATDPTGVAAVPVDPCASLTMCCLTLEDEDSETCQDAVSAADAVVCGETLVEFCPDQAPATPPVDTTVTTTDASATPMMDDPCTQLSTCCSTLDEEDQEDCQQAVDDADAMACADTQAELCPVDGASAPPSSDD